jgi:hypothetical protein
MVAERRFKSDLKTEMSRETDMLRTERLELTKANALIGLNLEIPEPETDSDSVSWDSLQAIKGRRRFGREELDRAVHSSDDSKSGAWTQILGRAGYLRARTSVAPPSAEGSPLCCDPIPNPPEPPTPKLPVFKTPRPEPAVDHPAEVGPP